MRLNLFLILITTLILLSPVSAQEDIQIGAQKYARTTQSGFFDFSDPTGINIKVQIWGYVRYPGFYVVPARSALNDLISLAGGPTEDALLEDIRVFRTNPDSSSIMIKYDYNNLLWGENINLTTKFPRLNAGDMLIVPGEPRYFGRQDVSFFLSILTALASVVSAAAIIINVSK